MKIPLTQGKYALVGWKDYAYLMQWKWYYGHNRLGEQGYAARRDGKQTIYMHCVILERMGFRNFAKSDHINRDRLDNRRCNLRVATNQQSNCNQSKRRDNASGYIGVNWSKQRRKWHVQIQVNREKMFLGYFDSKLEAAIAYNKAAKKYHGEFANLNKV